MSGAPKFTHYHPDNGPQCPRCGGEIRTLRNAAVFADERTERMRETLLDAAEEWQRFVSEDSAPMNLRKWLERALADLGNRS